MLNALQLVPPFYRFVLFVPLYIICIDFKILLVATIDYVKGHLGNHNAVKPFFEVKQQQQFIGRYKYKDVEV